jgi:hypothetical protein
MKKAIILLGLLSSTLSLCGQAPKEEYSYWGPFEEVVNPVDEYRSLIDDIRDWDDIRTITGADSLGPTVVRYFIFEDEIKYIEYYHTGERRYFIDTFYPKGKQLVAATSHTYHYSEDIPWHKLPDIWDYPSYGISKDLIAESFFTITYYSNGEAIHQLASGDCAGVLMDEYLDEVEAFEVAEMKRLFGLFRKY